MHTRLLLRGLSVALLSASCAVLQLPSTGATASSSSRVIDAVNKLRTQGCAGRPKAGTELRSTRELDAIAQRMSKGAALRVAVADGTYRVSHSASIHISKATDDATAARVLREQFCIEATDPEFEEIGVARRGQEYWIVLAQRFAPPAAADADKISQRVLELVNSARAHARKCGKEAFSAVPPVRLRVELGRAAHAQALDMAQRGFMSHSGSDGSTPGEHVKRAQYEWRAVAENVAAGQATADAAVQSWLDSPGHCANLMSEKFTEMGVAYVVNLKRPEGIFWSQVFAAPLKNSS
jgi:uncharacterized protein YkwD